ncbi:aminotransferase class V-fold PLP-dependent enzyme [Vacuolonema iberomarrocanum]|uniref:aminotransferase class V-fold PLP-dependent enzyme n=1 Tax=Vacuolonema iberomarrocanum TaxID=3454632 RepID=UPI001A0AAD12|nr:aminotransferase class V-fold PLP-dependent enzyme [filamentous cyanobacterium LEGE 07170]
MTSTILQPDAVTAQRQHFPALQNKAYFNYGGQGPMPQEAIAAIQTAHLKMQEQGPFGMAVNAWIEQLAEETRRAIAQELNVAPSSISFTENVSWGCNIPLWGLDWQAGDHIVLSDCEHPSVIATIQEIGQRFGVEATTFPLQDTLNGGDPVERLRAYLRPNTRLVALSHILWNTGQVLPLKEMVDLCHNFAADRAPVRVLVDAAQSVGVLPLHLDDLGADYYAFTGHKWLCGASGFGGLYVHPTALESIRPTYIGWRGIKQDATGNPAGWKPDGRRFEVASSDFTLFAAMQEALKLHQAWGTATDRYTRICHLSQRLWEQLQTLPGVHCLRDAPPEAGLVSFTIANKTHGDVVRSLEAQNIFLRTLRDPDCIRASVHYLTLESEIDQLVAALRTLLA